MDVRIGVSRTTKELEVELPDDAEAGAIESDLAEALSSGGVFWLTDRRGRRVGVPAGQIAYVEIGSPDDARRIGFGG